MPKTPLSLSCSYYVDSKVDSARGFRRTGSFITDVNWYNGKVQRPNFSLDRWGWDQTNDYDQGAFPLDYYTVFWTPNPNPFTLYPWETETDIGIDLSP